MPRRLRFATGGFVYHVLNRAVGRGTIFEKTGDYAAFEKVLRQARNWLPMRVLAYCAMPNHWHLVVWPKHDGDLSEYFRWLESRKRGRESFPLTRNRSGPSGVSRLRTAKRKKRLPRG